jgi:protein required for attachment to host cells
MSTSWILVSDAARARIFETIGDDTNIVEIACFANPGLRGTPNLTSTGRTVPRSQDSTGPARHIIEPHTSLRDKETQGFAHTLVVHLLEAHSHHRYDRLFLVAPPHFLGILRGHLRHASIAGLAGELPKDMVALPPAELLAQLRTHLPLRHSPRPARAS